jgi:hypothetical protein
MRTDSDGTRTPIEEVVQKAGMMMKGQDMDMKQEL